jgi:hypothetical protein
MYLVKCALALIATTIAASSHLGAAARAPQSASLALPASIHTPQAIALRLTGAPARSGVASHPKADLFLCLLLGTSLVTLQLLRRQRDLPTHRLLV